MSSFHATPNYHISTPFYTPSGVKWLLIVNIAVFFLEAIVGRTSVGGALFDALSLIPGQVVGSFAVWQPLTYLFLHADIWHILLNMLGLWMFGRDLEFAWGTRRFLQFYLICGVGAGLCVVLANLLPFGNLFTRTVGASGAIYGLMLAFAMLYPNRQILFYIFPIPAKYFVLILFLISFYSTIAPSGSPVSHVAHLGGMVIGFAYMRLRWSQVDLMSEIRTGYKDWKLRRAKRKFNVYMSKQNRDRGNWVN